MSLGMGIGAVLSGFTRGLQMEDERKRIEAQRAKVEAAAELARQRQWKREDAQDAQNAAAHRLATAAARAQLQASGIREGAMPKAASFQLPGLAADGMIGAPVQVDDKDRYTDLGGDFYLDRNATPQFQKDQQTRQDKLTATNAAAAEQQGAEQRRQALLNGLPRSVRGRATGLSLDQLERLQGSLIARDLTPREPKTPAAPRLVPGNDGTMYEYRNGQLVPVPVAGMPTPPAGDTMRQTNVPAMRGDVLRSEAPGAGFSRAYEPPAAPARGAAATPSPFGARGLFGKQKAAPPKYVEQVGALDMMDELIDQYEAALGKAGTALMQGSNPDLAEANAVHTQLMLVAKEAANLGVLNGPDLAIMEKAIGSPTGVLQNFRGPESIKRQLGVARATNKIKRGVLNKVYGQFPTQDTTPASRDDLNDFANQFMRNDE